MTSSSTNHSTLADKQITVAVTGAIPAYKTASLVSQLAQAGANVTVLMTESAKRFVGPLTFESLSGNRVLCDLHDQASAWSSHHISLARSTDLMLIAPASANTIAKLANGLCDNIITTTARALPRSTPLLLAPSMNQQMWEHPATAQHLTTLIETFGYHLIGPEDGWQACRTHGTGRMSEPETIFNAINDHLSTPP